jgi:hypothetical protein
MHSRSGLTAALAALVFAFSAPSIALGTTIVVSGVAGADAETIAEGMALAAAGDTVLVAAGTYAGPLNRDIDFGWQDVRLESMDGPAATVIDCESAGRAFVFTSGEGSGAVVCGFTIRGGHDDTRGGGVLCEAASPLIEDCIFENCTAWDGGVEGQGGAVFCSFSSATLARCTFRGNTAREGAAVYCADSPALVSGCLFVRNTALRGGGGIRILRVGTTVEGCTFFGNTAPVYGGGVYCCYSAPTITGCTFAENAASNGGAIYGYDASPVVTDCILAFSSEGAAVFCPGASAFTISYCCIFGNAGGDEACGTAHDNLFLDPAMCDTTGCEFRLQDCSPCVGAGSDGGDIGAWDVGCACDDTTHVPDETFTRLQVSPNPTAAGVRITYESRERERPLKLGIYSTAGRLVRDLTTDVRGAQGTVSWNGMDDSGRPVAAGVYLIRLTMETTGHLAKLVVVR